MLLSKGSTMLPAHVMAVLMALHSLGGSKYIDLEFSLVCPCLLTAALALCKHLWHAAINLVWSSFDITDVMSLSAVCPVFSAGCLSASYSDLSGKCPYS